MISYNKDALISDLKRIGVRPDGMIMVHSSMKAIGNVEGGADTVLDALCEYMKDGLLLLPTLTWKTALMDEPYFDVDETECYVGILPSLFWKRKGVYRSCQPTHSVAGYGKNAEAFLKNEELFDTPANRNGIWGKLYDNKGQILMLGAPLTSLTFIHAVEEWAKIPGRISDKAVNIKVKTHDGIYNGLYHHHIGNVSANYKILKDDFEKSDFTVTGRVGDAFCYLFEAKELCDYVTERLKSTPDMFGRK